MNNKARLSAIHGVIAMVAIVVIVALVVYLYVENTVRNPPPTDKETVLEFGKNLNWSQYQHSICMNLVIDWDSIPDEQVIQERDNWWRVPAVWQKGCSGPWEDISTTAYFNMATGEIYASPATDISDYWRELINIQIEIRDLLKSLNVTKP